MLNRETIFQMAQDSPPLVEEYLDLERQLQPNGFDLTVREVCRLTSAGRLGTPSQERVISSREALPKENDGAWRLDPGPYLLVFNEVVNLPKDLAAIGRPRSSLLRCGVALHTAVWDAGYHGRSEALLVVYNPLGYCLAPGAAVMQLVFISLTRPVVQGYQGKFQEENLGREGPHA